MEALRKFLAIGIASAISSSILALCAWRICRILFTGEGLLAIVPYTMAMFFMVQSMLTLSAKLKSGK